MRAPVLEEYRHHPKLLKRLPNFRVCMNFGLHRGWAIEGAVGSEYKIDATYLGPNVNLAARLHACTQFYQCHILASSDFVDRLSEPVRQECRLIDHVRMQGVRWPSRIFTLDLDDTALDAVGIAPQQFVKGRRNSIRTRLRVRRAMQLRRRERWDDSFDMHSMFTEDEDIAMMREKFTPEFFGRFHAAFLNYEVGEWPQAKFNFEAAIGVLGGEDGPSALLLKYMQKFDCIAPKQWKGYRVHVQRSRLFR
mmetsp:Transcript_126326/g.246332  ORF Transcript_126326/g.246332 Transcript_126326/m.246332 type:complete len:250 (+) Transcript_126326:1-750(+)